MCQLILTRVTHVYSVTHCSVSMAHDPMVVHLLTRSVHSIILEFPWVPHNQFGDRCFATAGPMLRNSLPEQLRQPDNVITFGQFKLKTFMFG